MKKKKIGNFIIACGLLLVLGSIGLKILLEQQQTKNLEVVEPPKEKIQNEYGTAVRNVTEIDVLNADQSVLFDFGIGRIDIDEIGLHVPLLEGDTEANLLVGAATMKPYQELGKGNYAIAGHRMNNRNLLFGALPFAELGQTIHVQAYQEKADFEIINIKIIEPEQTEFIDDSQGEELLTLITCNESGSKRLMIRASLKK